MKNRPIAYTLGFVFLLLTLFYTLWQQRNFSYDFYAEAILVKEKYMDTHISMAKNLSELDRTDEISPLFNTAINSLMFDWYIITYQNQPVVYFPESMKDLKFVEKDNHVFINESVSLKTVKLADGTFLTAGINKDPEYYYQSLLKKFWKVLVQDIVVPVIAITFLVIFFFKDFFKLIAQFRSRNLDLSNQKSSGFKSKEAQELFNAMSGFQSAYATLEDQKFRLQNQVLPSLQKEISSGKTPPYDFNCTLVRVDLNHFTEKFMGSDREQLLSDITKLFSHLSIIVSRYGGLIHEFVGDEVLFYFKDEDVGDSVSAALATLRDFQEENKLPYTTKSSLSYGTLAFRKHVNGFNLSGPVLIESVRLLSKVQERDKYTICFSDNIMQRKPEWCFVTDQGKVKLKGYSTEQNFYQVSSFGDFTEHSKSIWYRSPLHKEAILDPSQKIKSIAYWSALKQHRNSFTEACSDQLFKHILSSALSLKNSELNSFSNFKFSDNQLDQLIPLGDSPKWYSFVSWLLLNNPSYKFNYSFKNLRTELQSLYTEEWSLLQDPHRDVLKFSQTVKSLLKHDRAIYRRHAALSLVRIMLQSKTNPVRLKLLESEFSNKIKLAA